MGSLEIKKHGGNVSLITVYPAHLKRPLGQIGKKQNVGGSRDKNGVTEWDGGDGDSQQ